MKAWIWPLAFLSITAAAERRLTFQTPYDKFDLVLLSKGATVDGKPANIGPFLEVLPMLTDPLGTESCTPPGKAPITVKVEGNTRSIYPKQGLVSDGKSCLSVAGEGLHYFPMHREFLIGPKRDSIQLKSPLKIFRNGEKVASLKRVGKSWANEAPEQLLNWDFIERLENSLRDFDVRLRVQETIKDGKPKMIIQSGDQTYEFYKITNVMWAVKKPGQKWLEASDDWSFWYDFDDGILQDRYKDQIRVAADPAQEKGARMAALDKMDATWSPNMRDAYHKMLLNPSEDEAIQGLAIKRLKRKPSAETAGVLIQFLESSSNDDLKTEAAIALRLQNPKAPKWTANSSDAEKAKALEFWRNWWKQNSKAP
ncbi:MAG: hypothetical protein KF799_14125 [Bdellovibrionales bacterium]|nr:hypothetical protein [Bdellovibrionales bacterium]